MYLYQPICQYLNFLFANIGINSGPENLVSVRLYYKQNDHMSAAFHVRVLLGGHLGLWLC